MLSKSLEDYLEAILILKFQKEVVKIKDIVNFLNVKNSSVINAMRQLKEENLVKYEKYGFVDLTKEGFYKAAKIYSKHKNIAEFFNLILDIPSNDALHVACEMEHIIKYECVYKLHNLTKLFKNDKRLKERLNKMQEIKLNKNLENLSKKPLLYCQESDEVFFYGFSNEEVRKRLQFYNFKEGEKIEIKAISKDGKIIEIYYSEGYYSVSRDDAMYIMIKEIK